MNLKLNIKYLSLILIITSYFKLLFILSFIISLSSKIENKVKVIFINNLSVIFYIIYIINIILSLFTLIRYIINI
jgi:hypothetical protein